MKPNNIDKIINSFTVQADGFESKSMNFSKKDFLEFTMRSIELNNKSEVLEVAAGTCATGRELAPYVGSVTCVDITPAMLEIGKEEAKKLNISNMHFEIGNAENLPYPDESFDVVISRLAFHHFTDIKIPFSEMHRVLKPKGQLVIIDMEAAEVEVRDMEDKLEILRDPSHVKNIGRQEFMVLYRSHGYKQIKNNSTKISVSLKAWLDLTKTPEDKRNLITEYLNSDLEGGLKTGFNPYLIGDEIHFEQRWLMFIGIKE